MSALHAMSSNLSARLRRRIRPDVGPTGLALIAVLTGLIAGVGAVVFRDLIGLFHDLLFLGRPSWAYDSSAHTAAGPWGAWIIGVPVLGALVVAWMVGKFAPEAKGHGVPEVIDAIYYGRGVIRPVVAVIKSLASALSIGSGAAVGREGPIIQIGSAFGSGVGQLLRMPAWQRATLIGCGAGGGIAATFNTPIGGVLFAVELILPEVSARTLIPVTLATGAATFVGRMAFGDAPAFRMPVLAMEPTSLAAMGGLLLLGALLGLAAMVFIRGLYWTEDLFERLPLAYPLRHALGMALFGVALYAFVRATGHYYIEGVGYATIQDILDAALSAPGFLLLLFAAKLVSTSLALGSGASGGIFSPSLFLGAALGAAFASVTGHLLPALALSVPATALVAMCGMVAGVTGAVATAVVMMFEMTRDYGVVIPSMIAASVAYGVRRALLRDSIYTLKLTRRGDPVPESLQTNLYLAQLARDVLDVPFKTCAMDSTQPLGSMADAAGRLPHLVGVDGDRVVCVLAASDAARLDRRLTLATALAGHASEQFDVVRDDDDLLAIFARMRASGHLACLVTHSGRLESPQAIVGVFGWSQVAFLSNLPPQLQHAHSAA